MFVARRPHVVIDDHTEFSPKEEKNGSRVAELAEASIPKHIHSVKDFATYPSFSKANEEHSHPLSVEEKYEEQLCNLERKHLSFNITFDLTSPIAAIDKREEMVETFRPLWDEEAAKTDCLKLILNGKKKTYTTVRSSNESECQTSFMEWLLQKLDYAANSTSSISALNQATLFIEAPDETVSKPLIEFLEHQQQICPLTAEHYPMLANAIHDYSECPQHFKKWAEKKLRKFLEENRNLVPAEIVGAFDRYQWLLKVNEHVPSLRILQAMTPVACSFGMTALEEKFCPALFHTDPTIPRLQRVPGETCFSIEIKRDKVFTVSQKILYQFVIGREPAMKCLGSIEIDWKQRGKLKSSAYSAVLGSQNIQFEEDTPLETKMMILDMLIS